MSARLTCRDCRAFRPLSAREVSWGEWGQCRRRAPVLDGTCDLTWPRVQPHDWCLDAVPDCEGISDA